MLFHFPYKKLAQGVTWKVAETELESRQHGKGKTKTQGGNQGQQSHITRTQRVTSQDERTLAEFPKPMGVGLGQHGGKEKCPRWEKGG